MIETVRDLCSDGDEQKAGEEDAARCEDATNSRASVLGGQDL